jgi:HSP20 family protein
MDEPSEMHMQQWMPIKLYRTPDRVVIAAPMPGVRPEDVTVDVTEAGRVILQSTPRGALRDELFHVEVTVDRDGNQEVWTHEWWQETKEVLLDEWCACGYYREVELPAGVDATLGKVTHGNGVLVVALPVTGEMRSARLHLAAVGAGHGERVGIPGHQPV